MNKNKVLKKKMPLKIMQATLVAGALGAIGLANADTVEAHGFVEAPASRSFTGNQRHRDPNHPNHIPSWMDAYNRYGASVNEPQSVEGPGSHTDSGNPDWWETNRVADGQFASAGLDGGGFFGLDFSPLDIQTEDHWLKNDITPGVQDFTWLFTQPHVINHFQYFITKADWDPNTPLTNDDLELLTVNTDQHRAYLNDVIMNSRLTHQVEIPADREGYHVVLAVWDVYDTPAAFYQAIDVNIINDGLETLPPIEVEEKETFSDFFPDRALAQKIARHMGRNINDRVTEEELGNITANRFNPLVLTHRVIENFDKIESIEGMQYLTGVMAIELGSNQIQDLEPLRNLTLLTHLNLNSNKISDVEPLSNLTRLILLNLSINQISDLGSLASINGTVTANSQSITLEPGGNTAEGIFIRTKQGQTPTLRDGQTSSLTFNPTQGSSYNPAEGIITWGALGANTVSWSDITFNGTISQEVKEAVSTPEWDAFAFYTVGDRVTFNGQIWEALVTFQGHGDTTWAPEPNSTLWRLVN